MKAGGASCHGLVKDGPGRSVGFDTWHRREVHHAMALSKTALEEALALIHGIESRRESMYHWDGFQPGLRTRECFRGSELRGWRQVVIVIGVRPLLQDGLNGSMFEEGKHGVWPR
jgi:hypothetical protein